VATVPAEPPRWIRHLPWLVPLAVLAAVVLWLAFGPAREEGSGPPPIRHSAMQALPATPAPSSQDTPSGDLPAGEPAVKPVAPGNAPGHAASPPEKPATASNASVQGSTATKPAVDSAPPSEATSPVPTKPSSVVGDFLSGVRGRLDSLVNGPTSAPVPAGPAKSPAAALPPSEAPASSTIASASVPPKPTSPKASVPASGSPTKPSSTAGTTPPGGNSTAAAPAADNKPSKPAPSVAVASAPAPASTSTTGGERKGPLIVDPSPDAARAPGVYATLADACRAARNGDAIEVRANGPLLERPIDLVGMRLTIRAGDGFSPIVSFQLQTADPLRESHSMLTLAGSQLALAGLQLELDVPREAVADSWSLAEIRPGESLRLENCAVTVRNNSNSGGALHPDVAMFEIRGVPGAGVMATDEPGMMRPPASLQLKNCILRGEATVVRSDELQPLQITWDNGLLATSERFLSAAGGPSDPKPQGETQIELHHVTASMRRGLCRLTNSQDAPQQLPLEIHATDCIFLCGTSAALIEQSGIDATDDYRHRIVWNGERNSYDGFSTFWQIGAAGAETPSQSTFHDWKTYWGSRESQPSLGKIAWQQLPPASKPTNLCVAADFALRAGDNPGQASAADDSAAGMIAAQLRKLAEPPTMPPAPSKLPSAPPAAEPVSPKR